MLGIEDPRSLLEICKSSRTQFMLASSRELLSNDECKKKKVILCTILHFSTSPVSGFLQSFLSFFSERNK